MNLPNLNFDAEGGSARLPSTTAYGPGSVSRELREAGFPDASYGSEAPTSHYRRLLFWCLGLALKYRWLILTICAIALVIGFIATFTATPIYRATVTIEIDRQAPKVVKIDSPQDTVTARDNDRF